MGNCLANACKSCFDCSCPDCPDIADGIDDIEGHRANLHSVEPHAVDGLSEQLPTTDVPHTGELQPLEVAVADVNKGSVSTRGETGMAAEDCLNPAARGVKGVDEKVWRDCVSSGIASIRSIVVCFRVLFRMLCLPSRVLPSNTIGGICNGGISMVLLQ